MADKRGFNYSFKMFMEGMAVPFKGATVTCTPNGTEANINVYSNKELLDLKPKTAVQIFYREWVKHSDKPKWQLMFDGFFSSFYKTDQATEGRGIGLVCRDFRMDIRRAPAALAWEAAQDLTTRNFYNSMGIFQTFVIPGKTKKQGTDIRIFDNTGLAPLSYTLGLIAGSAGFSRKSNKLKNTKKSTTPVESSGNINKDVINAREKAKANKTQQDGQDAYSAEFGSATIENNGVANCGFYLDAIIRGMWLEAVGGTAVGAFLNKRIRVDKRFLIPVNQSGYNFWGRQKGSVHIGSHLMGNSRFSSLEAAIMRLAGAFSTRVYSCSTPSLIPIGNKGDGKPYEAVDYVIDRSVREFLVDRASAEFGGKYILNESMLLPPLEFTAPPNCNLLFPPMYDRVEWQHDIDADVTRGYFDQVHLLSTPGGNALASPSVQVPNALFNIMSDDTDQAKDTSKSKGTFDGSDNINKQVTAAQNQVKSGKDKQKESTAKSRTTQNRGKDRYGRNKPPLTLEERYKGVNVVFGSVSHELAMNDAVSAVKERTLNKKARDRIDSEIAKLEEAKDAALNLIKTSGSITIAQQGSEQVKKVKNKIAQKRAARDKLKGQKKITNKTKNALKHHALLKFLNRKYAGRVLNVDMAFNPYIMCGFPTAVIADEMGYGGESMKSIIGMVQQVKHSLYITPQSAEATTSIIINNARFEDEPTDMNPYGTPLYMRATDAALAKINLDTLEYEDENYRIPEPKAPVKRILNSEYYDLDNNSEITGEYVYAKDLLSLTSNDLANGKRNSIYVDEGYEPNKIAKFYRDVFRHNKPHFMIGSSPDPDDNTKRIHFMHDTIHEALRHLRDSNPELLQDYNKCIEYVKRNICSADAFFQGILGLSIRERVKDDDGNQVYEYVNFPALGDELGDEILFNDHTIYDKYYGVTTTDWDGGKVDGLKEENGGTMYEAGQFSSIREHMPITAFIQERRDTVEIYRSKVLQRVSGTQYAPIY
ncbi:MAG: hypothetical protein DRP09_10345 [Candidatus Thorarchaeota archaeon]|nr:MAG: hypothetical protein DRP09_10345 [Candidatus Thorarchaeota archaeon]